MPPAQSLAAEVQYALELDWEEVEGASGYEIEFESQKNKKIYKRKSKKPRWRGGLPVGLYKMRLRTKDDRGAPGPWSGQSDLAVLPPPPKIKMPKKINSKEVDEETVKFEWESVPGADSYLIRLNSKVSDFSIEKETSGNVIEMDLPVAQKFEWEAYSLINGVDKSFLSTKKGKFLHIGRINDPKIIRPSSEFIEKVTWEAVKGASQYQYKMYRKTDSGKWRGVRRGKTKKNFAKIAQKLPGGTYKIKVVAKGKYRKKSKPQAVEFEIAPDRGPAAIEVARLKEAVERPSKYHFVGSYVITQLNYTAENQEFAAKNSFGALGGSGRAGLGYAPKGTWGGMGFLEMSGFTVDGQTFVYFGSEVQADYKMTFKSHVLKVGAGIFSRQLPETLKGVNDTEFELEKITFAGPHLGVSYAIPFNRKLGIKTEARLYMGMLSMGTPNEQPIESTLSFQLSLLGSYRLTRKITGLLGYSMKKDAINYKAQSSADSSTSFADEGEVNSVSVFGHYLNMSLEWGF